MSHLAFVCPGQGSQAVGMGRALAEASPAAAAVFAAADSALGEAVSALANIRASGTPYVALTHYPTTTANRSQKSGFDYTPLNLERAPFDWPPPLEVWVERGEPGKTLALWRFG